MAEGRRERTHAWRFCLSEVRESMKGHLRLRKNSRKSITERSGDLVLGERKLPDHLFQPSDHSAMNTN
ncbi:hypothetical protein AB3S75_033429 [Citrus x aurantiifolia]